VVALSGRAGVPVAFPVAALTIGDAESVQPGATLLEQLAQRAESGYAKFWQGMIIQMLILGIFAMSYDLLLGYTGIVSFGHAMFFGTGGYAIAILIGRNFNWLFGLAPIAVVVIALVEPVRVVAAGQGVYLAMVTLAFAEMFFILAEAGDFRVYTESD
jgi:branched-chain amino acid transport system permease protein